jgi:hypothetical protein
MRKLVDWTLVSLDGVIDSPAWARPFLNDEHHRFALALLDEADAMLLEPQDLSGVPGLSVEAGRRDRRPDDSRPRYVAASAAKLKAEPGGTIFKFRTAALDRTLLDDGLVDELSIDGKRSCC